MAAQSFVGFCDFLIVVFTLELLGLAFAAVYYIIKREHQQLRRRAGRSYIEVTREGDDMQHSGHAEFPETVTV
jgi:hypothetical protein